MTFYLLAYENSYSEKMTNYYNYVAQEDFNQNYLINRLEKKANFMLVIRGMRRFGQESYLGKVDIPYK